MYYTQEQIDRANQADLVSFLQSQGEQLTRARTERPHGALLQFGAGVRYCMYRIGGRLRSMAVRSCGVTGGIPLLDCWFPNLRP